MNHTPKLKVTFLSEASLNSQTFKWQWLNDQMVNSNDEYNLRYDILFQKIYYIKLNLLSFLLFCLTKLILLRFAGCRDGTYGIDCLKNCSSNCLDNLPCNKRSGMCVQCKPGWRNDFCTESKIDKMYSNISIKMF